MSSDFPHFDAPETPRPRVRPPLDYRSRNAKLRLFGAVALLILVLALAERAKDAKSWNWFFQLGQEPTPEKRIDTRIARQAGTAEGDRETVVVSQHEAEKLLRSTKDEKSGRPPEGGTPTGADKSATEPVKETWAKSWKAIWHELGASERTLVYRLLEAAEDGNLFDKNSSDHAQSAVDSINQRWDRYQSDSFQEVGSLTGDEQARWVDTLRQINARWHKEIMPALQLVALGGNLSKAEKGVLADFQKDLDQISLAQVRDDAAFLRPDENQIWFHLFHQLQSRSEKELAAESLGTVGYSAMYNQPETYRGKLVTVKAQVRWAYRVKAIDNYLGVKEFNVLYLCPEGQTDNPFVVYSLGLPPGFPQLADQNAGRGMTKMYEDVVVTGYFFKRGAYRGQDANYTAPLMLANVPAWTPSSGQEDTTKRGAGIWREVLIIAAALFAAGVVILWVALTRGSGSRRRFDDEAARRQVAQLQGADLGPSLKESLKRLAEESDHGK